jgi:nitrous oxidase accessory protein NosD
MTLFDPAPVFNGNGRQVPVQPGDSITSFIQRAEPGTTIVIPAGEYTETLVIDREITIQGPELEEGQEEPLVIFNPSPGRDCLTLSSTHVVLRNLKFISGKSQSSTVVDFLSGVAVFEACVLSSPSAAPSDDAASPSLPSITTHSDGFLYFADTTIESGDVALAYVDNNVSIEFTRCELTAPKDLGIEARGNSRIRLVETKVTECADTALLVLDDASIEIVGTTFSKNGSNAIELSTKSQDNSIADSVIEENANAPAILCSGAGKLTLTGTGIGGCATAVLALDGFVVQCGTNTLQSQAGFPIVAANGGSEITLDGDKLSGECLVGIAVTGASSVSCVKAELSEMARGASVTGDSTLTFSESALRAIEKCAIEAHDSATLQVDGTRLEDCGEIGILIQKNVAGWLKKSSVKSCDYGVHLVSNAGSGGEEEGVADFTFEGCQFEDCRHTGVNLKTTAAAFIDCTFANNKLGETEEEAGDPASAVDIRGAETKPTFTRCKFEGNDQGAIDSDYGDPTFTDSEFSGNDVGAYITGALGKLVKCTFDKNAQAGVWVDGESDGSATECTITGTETVGALVDGEQTFYKFIGCTFTLTVGPTAVAVKDGGTVELTDCEVTENQGHNLDISAQGHAKVTGGSIAASGKGVGVKVMGQGTDAEFSGVSFSGEQLSAVLIGQQAVCNLDECDISECGTCGICIQTGGSGLIANNKIHDITGVGVQVDGGTPNIQKNEITACGTYGVHICSGAEPQVIDNSFRGNGMLDVNRE